MGQISFIDVSSPIKRNRRRQKPMENINSLVLLTGQLVNFTNKAISPSEIPFKVGAYKQTFNGYLGCKKRELGSVGDTDPNETGCDTLLLCRKRHLVV